MLSGTQARGGRIQQRDIAKATSTLEKTGEAWYLHESTRRILDKRILWSVDTLVQNLVLDDCKQLDRRVDVITRS